MRKQSPQSPRRRLRASFVLSTNPRSGRKISQKVIDSTSRRLSEPADKFKKLQPVPNTGDGTFAINFFKKNPHLKDESRPEDKIKKFDQILSSNCIDQSERLKILVQKKMLIAIVYGQLSTEYLQSVAALGSYYNSTHRITSAIRNLEEAIEIDNSVSNSMEESMKIRIELAEAYLNLPSTKKSELVRNTNKAINVIKQYSDIMTADPKTNYRKSHIFGKIAFRKNDFNESIERYNEALAFLEDVNNGQETAETANLYFEIGKVCSRENLAKTAGDYYQKSYDIFIKLNMPKQASILETLLPTGEEVDLVYGSENDEDPDLADQVPKYQNDPIFESHSSAIRNGGNYDSNENESSSNQFQYYLGGTNNANQKENEMRTNSGSSNENINSFGSNNENHIGNDSEDKGSSESVEKESIENESGIQDDEEKSLENESGIQDDEEKSLENESGTQDDEKESLENESENQNVENEENSLPSENNEDENESNLPESETENDSIGIKKNRPDQDNYQVEIEEEEKKEEETN